MSNLDPSGPAQPSIDTPYTHPANPALTTSEQQTTSSPSTSSDAQSRSNPSKQDRRLPSNTDDTRTAVPSSLGYGVTPDQASATDAGGDEKYGKEVSNTEGEQMRAPGEGDVADAVRGNKYGGDGGEQGDLAAGLERKRDEQAELREERRGERYGGAAAGTGSGSGSGDKEGGVDVSSVLGGKAGFVSAGDSAGGRGGAAGDGIGSGGGGMQSSHANV